MPQKPIAPRRERVLPPTTTRPAGKPTWDTCVERFLLSCRAKDLSSATVKLYTSCLTGERTTTFRQDHGIVRPSGFSGELLQRYEVELRDAGMTASTVGTYHKTIKRLAFWCEREGLDIDRSVLAVEAPRKEQKRPEVYTDAEVQKLMNLASPRDQVIIELLYRTGIRLDELINLSVDDIIVAPEGTYLHVRRGKGRKQRVVPLDTRAHRMSRVLTNYIVKIRPRNAEYDALFISRKRMPLTAEGVKHMLARLGEQAGIHTHAHKFRHTFATQAIRDGVDALVLQRVLGHANLGMVSHYVQFDAGSLTHAWLKRGAA